MPIKVSADFPQYPKGMTVAVLGVPVENGGSVELTDEQVQDFETREGKSVNDVLEGHPHLTVEGSHEPQTQTQESSGSETPTPDTSGTDESTEGGGN